MKAARMALLVALAVCANAIVAIMIYVSSLEYVPAWLEATGLGAYIAIIALSVACIIFAAATHGRSSQNPADQKGLGIPLVICKILLIPLFLLVTFFVIAYFLVAALMTLSVWFTIGGVSMGVLGAALLPLLALLCYMLLAATSSFSLSAIIIEHQKGNIKKATAVIFGILQFIPIADVISYPIMVHYFRRRDRERNQLVKQPNAYVL